MDKIISKDGVPISYQRSGAGPALILVHGANGDFSRWGMVQPLLAEYFTVYAMDRRGRGESGDGKDYKIQYEYEDVATLANSIDGPVDILGHSFGAACVMGAIKSIHNLRRLILYEPPLMDVQIGPQRNELLDKMDKALSAGNPEEVIILMLRDMIHIPEATIEKMRAHPGWAKQIPSAYTVPRELRSSADYARDMNAIKSINVPTLLLSGSASPDSFKETVAILYKTIPDSRVVVLEGQQHSAMLTGPEIFAKEVIRFLTESK
jgi:pimeloyl-ACP methyl ester carboxylesterase